MSLDPEAVKAKAKEISSTIAQMELDNPPHQQENWEGWLAFFDGVEDALFEARVSLHRSMLDRLTVVREMRDE